MGLLTLNAQQLTRAALRPVLNSLHQLCKCRTNYNLLSLKGIIIKQQNSYCGHQMSVLNG